MQSESKTENKNWRSKLDELSGLPDEQSPVLGNAWDKLETRLHPQPKSKRLFFYWAAAASLLLIVTFSWFKLQQGPQVLSPELVAQPKQAQPNKLVSKPNDGDANSINNNKDALAIEVKQPKKQAAASHVVKDDSNLIAKRLLQIQNAPVAPLVAQAPIHNDTFQQRPLLQTTQMQAVQTAAVAVNKPKVIHINDINPTGNNVSAVAQAGKQANGRVRFNHSDQKTGDNEQVTGRSTFNVKIPF
jgi:hypothetical protein